METIQAIESTEEKIIDEFSLFDNWEDKYEYIIDLGKKLEPLNPESKIDENKIKGCQSQVWLTANENDGRIFFKADSDAIIVRGLVSMLIRVLSGHSPQEIIDTKLDFINKIGMTNHLAQTRSNGLLSMVKQMKNYALAYKIKQQS